MSHYKPAGWGHGLTDERGRFNGTTRVIPKLLGIPLRWKRPRYVFVNSTSDTFHEGRSFEEIAALYAVMASCPQHTFIVLTKRPERRAEWHEWISEQGSELEAAVGEVATSPPECAVCLEELESQRWPEPIDSNSARVAFRSPWPLPNVIEGVSVEDQATADERIPILLRTPAARRMVSYGPSLGPVDFVQGGYGPGWLCGYHPEPVHVCGGDPDVCRHRCPEAEQTQNERIDYVISEGESGHGARPSDVQWHRDVAAQCEAAGVCFGLKQLGANVIDREATVAHSVDAERCWPDGTDSDGQSIKLRDAKGGDPSEWPADLRRHAITGPREFWGEVSRG
jgi:protein gp37